MSEEPFPGADQTTPLHGTPKTSRRNFLVGAGAVGLAGAAGVLSAQATGLAPAPTAAAAAGDRSYVAGRFALSMDGAQSSLKSSEGGNVVGEVVTEADGLRKHIGNVKYEDFSVSLGTGASKVHYDWIKASFDRNPARKSGEVLAADFNNTVISSFKFQDALLTEIGMPALDAASKDAAKMTIKFQPEFTERSAGQGGKLAAEPKRQKQWLPSNFRLQIDGVDCSRVNKIEALTIKQGVASHEDGGVRTAERAAIEPTKVEYPNLVITLPESFAAGFYQWHQAHVVQGKEDERTGSLSYLEPDLKTELFLLKFSNIGIFKVAPEKVEAGSDAIRRVKCEMYCEDIRFSYGSHAT